MTYIYFPGIFCVLSGVMSKAFVKVLDDLGFHTDAVLWLRTCALRVGDTFGSPSDHGKWQHDKWRKLWVLKILPSLCKRKMMALAWAAEAVSLPYSFRHMTNCNLCVPEFVDETLFKRYLANWWVFRIFPSFQCSYVQIIYLEGRELRQHKLWIKYCQLAMSET